MRARGARTWGLRVRDDVSSLRFSRAAACNVSRPARAMQRRRGTPCLRRTTAGLPCATAPAEGRVLTQESIDEHSILS
ncbi:hypothetical protein AKJ09_01100 [Labilithrix luteola]|uniref:Uncharacterized protein n=1 Tax=Labilithrix luteola TaxID=1391654 RepID=A0A0K1PM14_9BACT|nr:hypothetical protein AKJ09_01100 [Labilithrix luteola]